MTLDKLIELCKKQDATAQGEVYKQYNRILFAICLRYSPNYTEAEDNLQDAFITIFKKVEQYNGKGSFEGWMKRVTVNTVLQKYRKQRTFEIVDEGQIEDEAELEIESEEIPLDFLLKIVQELPDRYRLVFSMYVMDGYQHKEIAEMLGISDGTSKSNLARARMILKNKIEEYNATNYNT
ncbi:MULTISPECIES: RNA polymerase sigma factor [Aequorivita]|uniref:Sigma-70 family RNA polymerase sigma factor n=1 Tax=Aequorivita iocasae TaxID=2803865 RepID=A0ABX7DVZ4_9FLAO|nr:MULTISPECIES: sigma-70 family RNA polymerase sigma factor [Aequorivita]QQX77747.1 sigma-70 family RNA polymerase sigma factor [Aequorivita iocasae]UCA57247.1 sigma-70 family RNA polymerase sigma factor [Aequorivita sp. F7]